MECADDICLFCQALCCLTKLGLKLKILLEVVFASLIVELQQIVELFYVQLARSLSRATLSVRP